MEDFEGSLKSDRVSNETKEIFLKLVNSDVGKYVREVGLTYDENQLCFDRCLKLLNRFKELPRMERLQLFEQVNELLGSCIPNYPAPLVKGVFSWIL